MPICSWFTHWNWWYFTAMLVYERVNYGMKRASKVSGKRLVKTWQIVLNDFSTFPYFPCGRTYRNSLPALRRGMPFAVAPWQRSEHAADLRQTAEKGPKSNRENFGVNQHKNWMLMKFQSWQDFQSKWRLSIWGLNELCHHFRWVVMFFFL